MKASHTAIDASITPDPELELLLACARTELDESAERRVRELLEHGVDEDRLWRLAENHCVEPLVFLNLVRRAAGTFSSDSLASAKRRFEQSSNRTLIYVRELHRVLELLDRGGVRGVPYKGPLLAEVSYGNLLARTFYDLDIAVRGVDRLRALDLLLADGYRSLRRRTATEEAAHLRHSHEHELCSEDGKIAIELHWRFSSRHRPVGVQPEDLWDQLETRKLMGREVWSFPADALVCVLAAHGSGHQWMRLDWIACVAEHVRAHPELDWSRITERARAWGVLRATRLALVLAAELLGSPVPDRVLAEARAERSIPRLVGMIRARLHRGPEETHPRGEWLAYGLASSERLRDRWPYFRHQLRKAWLQAADAKDEGGGMNRSRTWRLLRVLAASGSPIWAWRLLRG